MNGALYENRKGKERSKEERKRTNRIILEHAERSALARPDHGSVVAGQGHGDEADGDGAGFCCWDEWVSLRDLNGIYKDTYVYKCLRVCVCEPVRALSG